MSRGLYYDDGGNGKYGGTFYYLEPESTTLLTFKKEKSRTYRNKYQAALNLMVSMDGLPELCEYQRKYFMGTSMLPKDLKLTPLELLKFIESVEHESCYWLLNRIKSKYATLIPQTKEYVGK